MNNRIVLIDPGHGGTDPGAAWKQADGSIIKEADKAWAISEYCYTYLNNQVKDMLACRTHHKIEVKRITASARIAKARELKPACFVSIHCNAAESTEAHGWEILVPANRQFEAINNKSWRLSGSIHQVVSQSNLDIKWRDFKNCGGNDRGSMLLNGVEKLGIPACLVEVGFLTNAHDRKLICDPDWQKRCGEAIARGIVEFLK